MGFSTFCDGHANLRKVEFLALGDSEMSKSVNLYFVSLPNEATVRQALQKTGFPTSTFDFVKEACWGKRKGNWKVTVTYRDDVDLNVTIEHDDGIGMKDASRFKGVKIKTHKRKVN